MNEFELGDVVSLTTQNYSMVINAITKKENGYVYSVILHNNNNFTVTHNVAEQVLILVERGIDIKNRADAQRINRIIARERLDQLRTVNVEPNGTSIGTGTGSGYLNGNYTFTTTGTASGTINTTQPQYIQYTTPHTTDTNIPISSRVSAATIASDLVAVRSMDAPINLR